MSIQDQIITEVIISRPRAAGAVSQKLRIREIPTADDFTFTLTVANGNDCPAYFEFPKDSPDYLVAALRNLQEAMLQAVEGPSGFSGSYEHKDR